MPQVIDLSYPVAEHFRWKVERRLTASFAAGDAFQVTRVGFPVHGFTHIDAPRHMVPGGATTSDFDLDSLVGEAVIVDLARVQEGEAITADALSGAPVRPGGIVLLRTDWDRRYSLDQPEFWSRAPYLTREACEWLLEQGPAVVGFDFPQDEPIRGLLDGRTAPMAEFVSHDVLLRAGVLLIEYLRNLASIEGPTAQICALPLKVLDADGAPARVVALV